MIVLPMAGLSSRFFKQGFEVPKYMLNIGDKTVFEHALNSFEAFFDSEDILIICRDVFDTPEFVKQQALQAGLPEQNLHVVVLDHETSGQAETVAKGLTAAAPSADTELTIFNIDTFRPHFKHPTQYDYKSVDGYVEVFKGEGTHWSFVRPDKSDVNQWRAAEVTEKVRISDLCSTGLYYFRSYDFFSQLYAEIAEMDPAKLQGGERYIAPLYNIAIQQGCDIRYNLIGDDEVIFCGTPDEYNALVETLESK